MITTLTSLSCHKRNSAELWSVLVLLSAYCWNPVWLQGTETGLDTKRKSIGSDHFLPGLAIKQNPKVTPASGIAESRALVMSPGPESSPFGSAAAHMEGRCRQQPQAPVPLSPQPGRTGVRSRTTELGLGSYSWELAPCPEKGELNSEFGRFAFPRGRAQEPSWLEGISLTLLGTSSTLKLTTTGPIKAALFQQDRPHESGKRWPWALVTGPCSLLLLHLPRCFWPRPASLTSARLLPMFHKAWSWWLKIIWVCLYPLTLLNGFSMPGHWSWSPPPKTCEVTHRVYGGTLPSHTVRNNTVF